MAHATKRFSLLCSLTLALGGCATTSALRTGEHAEAAQDYDRAVVEYTRALQPIPTTAARQGLERSKLRAAQEHYTRGRRFHAAGRLNEALVELQLAAELNPERRQRAAAARHGPRRSPHQSRGRRATARRSSKRWSSARRTCSRRVSSCPPTSGCRPRSRSATPAAATSTRRWPASRTSTSSSTRSSATRQSRSTCATRSSRRARLAVHGDAQLLSRHGSAHGHGHSRYAGQANANTKKRSSARST